MYALAYVLVPRSFTSLQAELDRTLAPFMRGGDESFPRAKLAFYDETAALEELHHASFRYNPNGSVTWRSLDVPSYNLCFDRLRQHMAACRLKTFDGTFVEIEPNFDAFVRRFTRYETPDPTMSRYGRWLNPIGHWDWWELGGRFNGAITGERRPAGTEQAISSGPSSGRMALENLAAALGADEADEKAEIEANVELIASLKQAADRNESYWLPTTLVLPIGCCTDEDRWFDNIEWHDIPGGTRRLLGTMANADFAALVRAAYERFSDHAAAGIAYHF
jgi:hypothetical protein